MNGDKLIGHRGEAAVAEYLIARGHTVLDRNWRSGHLELDIVSIDSSGVHFVEVKTRTSKDIANPEESVGYIKQKRVAQAAARYLASKGRQLGYNEVFFDVAAVIFKDGQAEIEYFPNAFIPMG